MLPLALTSVSVVVSNGACKSFVESFVESYSPRLLCRKTISKGAMPPFIYTMAAP